MKCSFRKDLFSVSIAVVVSVVTQRFRDDPNTRLWKQHTTACFIGTSPSVITWYSRGFRSWHSLKMKGFKRSYRDCLYYGSLGWKIRPLFQSLKHLISDVLHTFRKSCWNIQPQRKISLLERSFWLQTPLGDFLARDRKWCFCLYTVIFAIIRFLLHGNLLALNLIGPAQQAGTGGWGRLYQKKG